MKQREETYRSFFENNEAVILLIDSENGKILFANKSAVKFYGWPRKQLTKMNINQINTLPPGEIKTRMAVTRQKKQNHFEFQHRLANGDIKEVAVFQSKLNLNDKEVFALIINDITQIKKAEDEVKESRELLRTTLYSIGDGVISTDNRGRIVHMNPVAEQLTGWQEIEAQGKPLGKVCHIFNEQTREKVENPVSKVLREGVVVGLANHTILKAKDGTERPIADSGAPIKN